MKPTLIIFAALTATEALAIGTSNDAANTAFDITFSAHVEAGMAEQDVFVATGSDADSVFRPGPDFADMNAPIFASSEPQAHAPMDPDAKGPYPLGASLDMTLGDWLGASGTGNYSCTGGVGRLKADFEGLVPGGVYTLWHFFMANGATEPFIGTFDLPIGQFDGSQSVLLADEDGSAAYDQSFEHCLQLTGPQLAAGLALNWHSDGQTYGVLPGAFGQGAHIQLFAGLPAQ